MEQRLVASAEEFVKSARTAAQRSAVPYVICVCPPSAAVQAEPLLVAACDRVQSSIASRLAGMPNVAVVTPPELFAHYPVARYHDDYAWRVGKIPYTTTFFTALGTMLARRMLALRSAPYQVIVADCDQTLWTGNAQLGPAAVEVDGPRVLLQDFLIAQQKAGKILCLVGKGQKHFIDCVLESNASMRLGPQDLADVRIDDRASSMKLQELSEEFGIDLGGFIFVSANPAECAEVRRNCETATVAQLPADATQIPRFLKHLWVFDSRPAGVGSTPLRHPQIEQFADIAERLSTVEAIARAVEPERARHSGGGRSEFAPPRNAVEEMLVGIWAQVLRVEQPGIDDNFFALGGHSLLAVQVVARVRETLDVEMPLRAMFDAPTIAQFAERAEDARRSSQTRAIPALRPAARDGRIPLSYAQQRLWFIDQLEPGNSLYNISAMYRMWGPLDLGALEQTINEIVRRHESLRTTFRSEDGQPVQVIAPRLRMQIPVSVRSGLADLDRELEIKRFAREQALRPFDLSTGPLLRLSLLKLGEEEHVLVVILHHIVGDGWSGSLLAKEMAALYEAFSRNQPSPLPELAVQYADFAIWQRQWMQGEILDGQIAYWKKQLAGAPPVLELPTDRHRPAVQAHHGAIRTHVIAKDLLERLKSMSQAEGVTLFMTLLASFQMLLSRYSGQEDIVVGSTVAGRNYSEVEPLIGFFINTLAMRTDLSGEPTFRELLARVKQVALDGYAHQEIPFEKLVEELQPERSLSYNPIFQVLFGLQNIPRATFEASGLKVQREPVHPATSLFDMSWFAFEMPEGLLLRIEYNTDLFEEATIGRAIGHFEQLLEGIVAYPEKRLSEVALLTPDERQQVLVEFNDTATDYCTDLRLQDFFAQQAEQTPDATALICGNTRLSYRELDVKSNQLAHYLQDRGAGPDVPVGIFCERTPDLLIGILGILKSGSAYVPIDPAYPKERIAHILEDAKAPIALTQTALLKELPNFAGNAVCLDGDWEKISRESSTKPSSTVDPKNLAYVLFTSGSTGRPKGVALEHRSAATFVRWAKTVFTPAELAGVLFSTSVCFDLSVFEMFAPLSVGGKTIIVQNALFLPSAEARDEVTLINTVPSAMAELVRMQAVPESVKTINLAGEALAETLVNEIYSSTSAEKVYNLYGPTEDTTYSTYTLTRADQPVTIGRPLPNSQAYVLDPHGNPQPVGAPGELYLAGAGLARGYFGRPDLTAERFVANPFSEPPSRMYRTGDLCRWLPTGELEYLGRLDHQVKLRGFRIELGEIEAVLGKHAGVRQCLVMAREDQPGLTRLVAYVVSAPGEQPTEDSLRAHLKQSVPEFMLPSAFVFLEAFPLTPNGKVNRKALPAPEFTGTTAEYAPPRNATEERVAGIWAEVLHVEKVGIYDEFFSLGGHSLLATQVISRIRKAFNADIPLRALFEAPTVAGLARLIEQHKPSIETPQAPPMMRVPRTQDLPLSFAQQRLWFLNQLEPDNPFYNIPQGLRMRGNLDVAALEKSLDEIVRRHEILRTTYRVIQGQISQTILPAQPVALVRVDLTAIADGERDGTAQAFIDQEARRPFDLEKGPVIRASLLSLASDEYILVLNTHHIASDGWSMGIFVRELTELYTAFVQGKPSPLAELPAQYIDFAVWQRNWISGDVLNQHLEYWRKQLQGAPGAIELPADRPRPAVQSFRGAKEDNRAAQRVSGCDSRALPARGRNVVHGGAGDVSDTSVPLHRAG